MQNQFRIAERHLRKFNASTCFQVEFTPEGVEFLKMHYHEIRGLPGFLDDCLNLNPDVPQMRVLLKHPELISWNSDATAVLLPNGAYHHEHQEQLPPTEFKKQPGGLAIIAWFIHPEQLKETAFSHLEIRKDFQVAGKAMCCNPSAKLYSREARHGYQKRIRDLETNSTVPYLASVLDLKAENLPWLYELRGLVLKQLECCYGVDSADQVSLYFHRLIKTTNATLHLHARINQGVHPMETTNRLMLDDIVKGLEEGITIEELYCDAGIHCRHNITDIPTEIRGIRIAEIPNPFRVTNPWVSATHGKSFEDYSDLRHHYPPAIQASEQKRSDPVEPKIFSRPSRADLERIFEAQISPLIFAGTETSADPQIIIVGGQSGAGKSTFVAGFKEKLQMQGTTFAHINGEALYPYHPDYMRLMFQNDRKARSYINQDLGVWAELAVAYAKRRRINILMESTMRDSNRIIKYVTTLRDAHYKIDVCVMAVSERLSREGITSRYKEQKANRGIGNYVSLETHDAGIKSITYVVDWIEYEKLADTMVILRRGGDVIYENRLENGEWIQPMRARHFLESERCCSMSLLSDSSVAAYREFKPVSEMLRL